MYLWFDLCQAEISSIKQETVQQCHPGTRYTEMRNAHSRDKIQDIQEYEESPRSFVYSNIVYKKGETQGLRESGDRSTNSLGYIGTSRSRLRVDYS